MEKTIQFPENMLFGVGSSAYQIEGGWNADGKSPSIQDHFFHTKHISGPKMFSKDNTKFFHRGTPFFDDSLDNSSTVNGDIACDSYNKIDEDIQNLIDLGVEVYRFSISWPRVLPKGDSRYQNEAGINYYKNLIQKLLDNNIQPLVTMYHWDLPNTLQNLGGWASSTIVEYFSDYATFLFQTFGENVKMWCTINEPRILSMGYGSDVMAPGAGNDFNGIGNYSVWRNLLLAHAAVYKIYKNSFKAQQQGEICISLDTMAFFPQNPDNEEHRKASSIAYDYNMGVFIQPLVSGEYPKSIFDAVQKTNKSEQFNNIRRLVPFTAKEKEDLIGSYDFLAFNYYYSANVRPMTEEEYASAGSLALKDMGLNVSGNTDNMNDTFKGFSEVIDWLMKTCDNPTLFITENGISGKYGEDDSNTKIKYHHGILRELSKAIGKGISIKGYTMWSFMDSLEWSSGYFEKLFGIFAVDFNDPKRPRSKKQCFEFFHQLFKTKTLPSITQ